MTPTARTLELLRSQGYTVAVVERHIRSFITVDLFGCIDIVAVKIGEPGVLGVQATSGTNHNARVLKSCAEERLRIWLLSGNRFKVVSWAKRGPRGQCKRWTPRMEELHVDDLPDPLQGDLPKPNTRTTANSMMPSPMRPAVCNEAVDGLKAADRKIFEESAR